MRSTVGTGTRTPTNSFHSQLKAKALLSSNIVSALAVGSFNLEKKPTGLLVDPFSFLSSFLLDRYWYMMTKHRSIQRYLDILIWT